MRGAVVDEAVEPHRAAHARGVSVVAQHGLPPSGPDDVERGGGMVAEERGQGVDRVLDLLVRHEAGENAQTRLGIANDIDPGCRVVAVVHDRDAVAVDPEADQFRSRRVGDGDVPGAPVHP